MCGGPARVKCHSKRSDSSGEAWRLGSGLVKSSEASFRIRLMVGDLVLKVGRDIMKGNRRKKRKERVRYMYHLSTIRRKFYSSRQPERKVDMNNKNTDERRGIKGVYRAQISFRVSWLVWLYDDSRQCAVV